MLLLRSSCRVSGVSDPHRIIWPLLELSGPSDRKQLFLLIPWVLVVLLAALLIASEASRARRLLKGVTLSPKDEAAYQHFILQFEGRSGGFPSRSDSK
jgi:hypothetical protein